MIKYCSISRCSHLKCSQYPTRCWIDRLHGYRGILKKNEGDCLDVMRCCQPAMDLPWRITKRIKRCILPALAIPPVQLWFMFLLYFITFIILLPWICSDWPYSIYFSSSWKQEELAKIALSRNEERLQMADNYIARLDFAATLKNYEEMLNVDDVDIAIGVITVRRQYRKDDIGYLTQVMARMDKIFQKDEMFGKKALFICNVHAGPSKHHEAERLGLYFPVSTRFPEGDPASVIMEHFEKEKQDYMYCLEEGMNYRPRYVMLVEDDALPGYNMLAVLRHALESYIEKRWRSGDQVDQHKTWAYLKLYFPEKWQGYASELHPLSELLTLGTIGGIICLLVLQLCPCRNGRSKYRVFMRYRSMAFGLGAVYIILFAMFVGRPYMLKMRMISPVLYNVIKAPGCCTQSILYPAYVIPDLLDHLHNVKCTASMPVDLAIDDFVSVKSSKRYLIEPNLFTHIGYISSIKGPSPDPALFIH